MNLPMSWLKKYVDIDCDVKTFEEKMTLSGSKVESIMTMGDEISKVVVGKILSVNKHPDADKLVVCSVDVGNAEHIQIVTGADNVFAGAYVPVALDGATLANNVKIKKGKLRGEVSDGMMCSVEELGFGRHDFPEAPEHGIYIFAEAHPVGADVKPLLQIDDTVVEFEITSNRPDCFSILGLAREAAATFRLPLQYPSITLKEEADGDIHTMVDVEIQNSDLCPRYIARVVKNVTIAPSPLWLRHCLTASGIRPINNIVDITNFVMLEMGQPMHAFNIDTIDGKKIIVRNAQQDEKFVTLDGNERVLDASMLVIADCNKAVAIAGVMGGENSMVSGDSATILFESANFNGPNIRLTSKKLGLRTDASGKYEKGIDPNLAEEAVNRAVQLVELLGCGDVVPGMVDCYPSKRETRTVTYAPASINKLLGTDISSDDMVALLKLVEVESNGHTATIPSFRPDLETEADLAEEVARLFGYDKIETTLSAGTPTVGKRNETQIKEDIVKNTMIAAGLYEIMNYSFESPKVFQKLLIEENSSLRHTVTISNPLGEDYSIMRTSTLNGMLQSLSTNYNRRNTEAALFEVSKVYRPKALPLTELPDENNVLSIGMYGKIDFYTLKGVVEQLMSVFGAAERVEYCPAGDISFMHPGRCATLQIDGVSLGYLGQVHPQVLSNYEVDTDAYMAIVDLDLLFEKADMARVYKPLPKYPAMQRDLAMLVKDDVLVKDIETIIARQGGKTLEAAVLFDVYKGKQIQEGYKSVAYNLTFRATDRTLTDEEVNTVMKKILRDLEEKLDAQLRM